MSCDFQDSEVIQLPLNRCCQFAGVAVSHDARSASHSLPGCATSLGEDRRENARCGSHIWRNQETHCRVGEEHRLPWQHEPAERVGGMAQFPSAFWVLFSATHSLLGVLMLIVCFD